jgi:hypothetical protein
MNIEEVIALLETHKATAMQRYAEATDPLEKAEWFGMCKGYESALILIKTIYL